MSTLSLNPPAPGLNPEQYRKYIKDAIKAEITRIGVDNVLTHKPFVIMYSGPSETVRLTIGYDPASNNRRSLAMAIELNASRINDTQAAVFLNGQDLNTYFTDTLSKTYSDPLELKAALNEAYATVWGGISELFAELDFKRVATAVCGAGRDRVFLKEELPVLVKNPHIEIINDIDMRAVRRLFNEVSSDEAFRLICLSEIKMIQRQAEVDLTSPGTRWQDFSDRRDAFAVERSDTEPKLALLTANQLRCKQEIIARFNLDELYATDPATWGGPTVPVPTRGTTPKYARHAAI